MSVQPLPLLATSELVAAAWIGSIPGLSPQMTGEVLPPDVQPDGTPAPWLLTGFITVQVAGGSPDADLPVKKPVIQVDAWAAKPGSSEPPWLKASVLAETVRYACLDRVRVPRLLRIQINGVAYPSAQVMAAYLVTEPRRLYEDPAMYARVQMDMAIQWRTAGDVTP